MPKRAVSFADDIETRVFKRDKKELETEDFDMPMEEDVLDVKHKNEEGGEDEKKKHHTLESDEEEEEEYKRLDTRKVEGQEEGGIDFEGSTKITAFNMKEDEEEGHFDESGNFIFKKKEKEIQDAWLDGIDWSLVKKRAGDQWEGDAEKKTEIEEDDGKEPVTMNDIRKKDIFEKLVEVLQPNQTVAKALADLKKKKGLSAAEERKLRWAAKKAGKAFEPTDGQKETALLSGLADELISAGFMDAYEWHREKINFLLQRMISTAVDEVDMFSDEPVTASSSTAAAAPIDVLEEEDTVKWEYKENEESKILGPFSTSEMLDRQSKGQLSAKGIARREGTKGSFNPVARIDFELYL
ncbi:unnamed protein product [Caenorhabditis sp. 36 PRJEB53466]|nr:unnamed protein product [Caenorhabditis sp. 36 PRJEB53466]